MDSATDDGLVERARRFNRFYTRAIGVLGDGYLDSPYSLAQARVLYEIASQGRPTATGVAGVLGLDAGYLSRMLKRLEADGLVERVRSEEDRRENRLGLTQAGLAAFAALNQAARAGVGGLLKPLGADGRARLAAAMDEIEALLSTPAPGEVHLRGLQHGDLGWVVQRHGVLYAREQGWTGRFEALAAKIVGDLCLNPDPARERGWIAERDGQRLGCVFLARDSDAAARIRLLLVEPAARGLGLGRRLTEACLAFAREAGYREVVLWTHANLTAARRIYAGLGFDKVEAHAHDDFGPTVISETWRLEL